MIRCSEDCRPICDFCAHYCFNAIQGCYEDLGYCSKHNKTMEPEYQCNDFHCMNAPEGAEIKEQAQLLNKDKFGLTFTYTNWKGESRVRTVLPIKMWYGVTDYHPNQQWFLKAFDLDKNQVRDFAFKDIGE